MFCFRKQQLREDKPDGVSAPIARNLGANKATRFSAQTPRIEAGELLLPIDALWLANFERELFGFANLKQDDQADALPRLLAWSGRKVVELARLRLSSSN